MKSPTQSSGPAIDPFADTMRISLIDDTLPLTRLSPKGEFHEGELSWFEPDEIPPGPAATALAEADAACPAASWFIIVGAAALPFVALALL